MGRSSRFPVLELEGLLCPRFPAKALGPVQYRNGTLLTSLALLETPVAQCVSCQEWDCVPESTWKAEHMLPVGGGVSDPWFTPFLFLDSILLLIARYLRGECVQVWGIACLVLWDCRVGGIPCLFVFKTCYEHRFQTVLEFTVSMQVFVPTGVPEVPSQDPELGLLSRELTSRPVSFPRRPVVSLGSMHLSAHARLQLPSGTQKGRKESSSPRP